MSSDPPKKWTKSMFKALFSTSLAPPPKPPKPSSRHDDISQAFDALALSDPPRNPPGFVGGFNPGYTGSYDARPRPGNTPSGAGPLPRPPPMPMPTPSLTMQYALGAPLYLDPLEYPHAPPTRPQSVPAPAPPLTTSISTRSAPTPARPKRARSASMPPATGAAQDGKTQCSGVTKAGKRCTRTVKAGPPLSSVAPELALERFCFQHSRELMGPTGFYARDDRWVDFAEWIPAYLQTETQVALRAEMEKPRSAADVDGYIYTFEIRDPSSPSTIKLKVGRTVHLIKRIDQWGKQCGTKEQVLRGWWPGATDDDDPGDGSLMKGRVRQGKKGPFCHRLERLVHLELADLVVCGAYLDPLFPAVQCPAVKPGLKKGAASACEDCGSVHKEIFEFRRVAKGKEWESIVKPVIEKWGNYCSHVM